MSGAAIDAVTAGNTPTARLLARAIPLYRSFFTKINGIDGIYLHDPTAVAYLLEPTLFGTETWPVRVETQGISRGKTWPHLGDTDDATPAAWQGRPLVNVCVTVDAPRVLDLVGARLR